MKATANHMRRNEIVGECCLQTGHCRSLPGFFSLYSPPRTQEKKIHLSATFSPLSLSLAFRAELRSHYLRNYNIHSPLLPNYSALHSSHKSIDYFVLSKPIEPPFSSSIPQKQRQTLYQITRRRREMEMSLAIVERQGPHRPVAGCVGVLFFHLLDWNRRLARKKKKRVAKRSLLPPLLKRCPKQSSRCPDPHSPPPPQLVFILSFTCFALFCPFLLSFILHLCKMLKCCVDLRNV